MASEVQSFLGHDLYFMLERTKIDCSKSPTVTKMACNVKSATHSDMRTKEVWPPCHTSHGIPHGLLGIRHGIPHGLTWQPTWVHMGLT
jgi:hypothetical protein